MRTVGKVFFCVIATILLFALWTAGDPPAVSFFWETEIVEVVGHETEDWDSGWGVINRTLPRVKRSSDDARHPTALLFVDGPITDPQAIAQNWPLGMEVKSRIHPFGRAAFPTSTWPFMTIPAFGFSLVLFFLIGYQIHRLIERRPLASGGQTQTGRSSSAGWIIGLFLLVFTLVPVLLVVFAVNFGDPPPRSIIWPRETVQIISSEARIFNVGNGTQAAYVDVFVSSPDDINSAMEQMKGTTYSSVSIREAREMVASRYQPGEMTQAMRSPDGDLYVKRFRLSDGFAIITILLSGMCLFAARLLWRVFS